MPFNIYKPKEDSTTGAMVSLSFNSKEQSVFITGKKQKTIAFREKAFENALPVTFKLSLEEVGRLSVSILERKEFLISRISNDGSEKTLRAYWLDKGMVMNFKYEMDQKILNFFFGFTEDDLFLLRKYIDFSLDHIFSAIYAADKKQALDNQPAPSTSSTTKKKTKKEATIALREEQVDDGVISFEDNTSQQTKAPEAQQAATEDAWPEPSSGYTDQDRDF